ncbi:MAG: hypothetical protein Q9227_008093 [Pyrenula ochraceoflavens]
MAIAFVAWINCLLPHSTTPPTEGTSLARYAPNDKFLHLVFFFLLTLTFYFILDTSRRRVLNLTLLICTFVLGVGSEFVQGFLPNGREFDLYDIVANVAGSLAATGLASWYHKRMLERRRMAKYGLVAGEEDVELGVRDGEEGEEQETGVVERNPEEELDNWDENAEDDAWDEEDDGGGGERANKMTPTSSSAEEERTGD